MKAILTSKGQELALGARVETEDGGLLTVSDMDFLNDSQLIAVWAQDKDGAEVLVFAFPIQHVQAIRYV